VNGMKLMTLSQICTVLFADRNWYTTSFESVSNQARMSIGALYLVSSVKSYLAKRSYRNASDTRKEDIHEFKYSTEGVSDGKGDQDTNELVLNFHSTVCHIRQHIRHLLQ